MNKYKTVNDFLADQSAEKLDQINLLREIIMRVEPSLEESIKWNAPNYSYRKEDRITFNLMNKEGKVKLILHMGASKKENRKSDPVLMNDEGLVEWNSDIRGTISFLNVEDIKISQEKLRKVIRNWLHIKT